MDLSNLDLLQSNTTTVYCLLFNVNCQSEVSMWIEEKNITLKNGQTCLLRVPQLTDAEQLVDFLKATSAETDFVIRYPEEADFPVEQERFFLQHFADAARELMILAVVDGKIAGNCQLAEIGKGRLKVRHRCSIAIALYKEYWGLGIGKALIERLAEKAVETGYEQMELEVVSGNERAIGLYRRMGFVKTGEIPRAMKFKDGSYDGIDIMVKDLRR